MDGKVAEFIREPLQLSLLSVPGVDTSTQDTLNSRRICNTHQLIGQLLLFHANGVDPQQLHDRFSLWLEKLGVTKTSKIIASAVAQKVGTWVDGVFDGDIDAWDLCCDVGGCSGADLRSRLNSLA